MKCVSFNVNSIRTRLHQLDSLIKKHTPDFIGLQETKVADDEFPVEAIHDLGYEVEYHGQKGHYGVALLSREPFIRCTKGFSSTEAQKRFIAGDFELESGKKICVLNAYFPQGEHRDHPNKFANKKEFYQRINKYLRESCDPDSSIVLLGDMNVSPEDVDIGIGEQNRLRWISEGKCSFLSEERAWFTEIINYGMRDTYRERFPDNNEKFSWFDYRSRGFERNPKQGLRIDFVLASKSLINHCIDAGIDYEIRSMERPSDHCPVWAEFDI